MRFYAILLLALMPLATACRGGLSSAWRVREGGAGPAEVGLYRASSESFRRGDLVELEVRRDGSAVLSRHRRVLLMQETHVSWSVRGTWYVRGDLVCLVEERGGASTSSPSRTLGIKGDCGGIGLVLSLSGRMAQGADGVWRTVVGSHTGIPEEPANLLSTEWWSWAARVLPIRVNRGDVIWLKRQSGPLDPRR